MAAQEATLQKTSSSGRNLFADLRYFVASSIPIPDRTGLCKLLNREGGIQVDDIRLAHIVFSKTEEFEGSNRCPKETPIVLPEWIQRSLLNGQRQDPQYFSPDPRAIFSTLVIASDHLPPGDLEAVIAGTHARGGLYRDGFTRDVTHLLVLAPAGDKYHTARKFADKTGVKIVMANWFDDCFKTEHRVPEEPYEQAIIQAANEYQHALSSAVNSANLKRRMSRSARNFYDALEKASPGKLVDEEPSGSGVKSVSKTKTYKVWSGHRILLSHSLLLSDERRETVELELKRLGAQVVHALPRVDQDGDSVMGEENEVQMEIDECERFELAYADQQHLGTAPTISERYRERDRIEAARIVSGDVDVLITKYRSGLPYIAAVRTMLKSNNSTLNQPYMDSMMVGTLAWLFYVHINGAITPPTEQLLHFPARLGAVQGIRGKKITITNYQGPAREYLKKLISIMAGPRGDGPDVFTTTLSSSHDLVIASKLEGEKVKHAQVWQIPIVNHLWLESTFREWKYANLSNTTYVHWTQKVDYANMLPGSRIADDPIPMLRSELKLVTKEMRKIGYTDEEIAAVRDFNAYPLIRDSHPDGEFMNSDPWADDAVLDRRSPSRGAPVRPVGNVVIPETSSPVKPQPSRESPEIQPPVPPTKPPTVPKFAEFARQPVPSKALRSPWDPSPTKRPSGRVVNDTPPRKASQPSLAAAVLSASKKERVEMARKLDVDYGLPEELEPEEPDSPIPKKAKGKERAQPLSRSDSPEPVPGMDKAEDVDINYRHPEATNKGKKRVMQTQSSDSDVKIESQNNLLTRRKKTIVAGAARPSKTLKEVDEAPHEERPDSGESDANAAGHKQSRVAHLAQSGAVRRLRDSISGKTEPPRRRRPQKQMDMDDTDEPMAAKSKAQAKGKGRKQPKTKQESSDSEINEEEESGDAKEIDPAGRHPGKPKRNSGPPPSNSEPGSESDVPNEPETSAGGRRKAAAQAAQRLHQIMPDANRFDEELRRGSVRGDWEDPKKRRRDEHSEGERHVKRRSVGGDARGSAFSHKAAAASNKAVRYLATKSTLSDSDVLRLKQLGIQQADKHQNCTHLVSNTILRTEKFLSAISYGPKFVTEAWLKECLAQKRVVDETPFLLRDEEGEKKFGCNLQETLVRAAQNPGKLFHGHVFYLNPSLDPVLIHTISSTIRSAGGVCMRQVPQVRAMEDHLHDRHFIGAEGEHVKPKIKELHQHGIPVYTKEVVLVAVLRQELPDWEEAARLALEGSES